MSVFAGVPGTRGYLDGPANSAQFQLDDSGLTVDPQGNVYVADSGNCAIRKISNGQVTTVVGGPSTCGGGGELPSALNEEGGTKRLRRARSSGVTTAAQTTGLIRPSGVTVGCNGNLVIADEFANRIFRYIQVGPNAGSLVVVAGNGNSASVDHEDPLQASFARPIAVSVDRDNNIIVSDHDSGTFRRIAAGQNVRGADGTAPNGAVTSPLGAGNPGSPLEYIAFTKDGNPVLVINDQRIALTYVGTPPTGYFPPNTQF
jgi:sugar lactone lactonase YvrE